MTPSNWAARTMRSLRAREFRTPLLLALALGVVGAGYAYVQQERGIEDSPLFAFERKLLDLKFQLRGRVDVDAQVVIAAGDERAVQTFGRWGTWDRARYGRILDNLFAAGADVVAFDMVFSDPPGMDQTGVDALRELLDDPKTDRATIDAAFREHVGGDDVLAKAFDDHSTSVVQGFIANTQPEDGKSFRSAFDKETEALSSFIITAYGTGWKVTESEDAKNAGAEGKSAQLVVQEGGVPSDLSAVTQVRGDLVLPQPEFLAAASNLGFFSAYTDPDGVLRRQPLVYRVGDVFIAALSLSTAAAHFGANPGLLQDPTFHQGLTSIGFPRDDGSIVEVPVDLNGRLLVNYYGPSGPSEPTLPDDVRGVFPRVSLVDIYNGTFDRALVKGKVVLVAVTAIGTFDQRVTPFSPNVPGSEIHAAAIQNIIDGRSLKRPTLYLQIEMLVSLLVALALGLVLPRLQAATSVVIFVLVCIVMFGVDVLLLFPHNMWFHDVNIGLQMLLTWAGITVWGYLTTGRDKARLKREFSTVLAPTVVEQLLKDPKLAGLGGMERQLTVMFSDIRGFTTMSEKLTPEGLTQFLNEYLTPMTEILIQREGTLDKYMGDAIMAFWGAPIEQHDHAARAALAALDMMEKLQELRVRWAAEGKPDIDIGIGLNSGLMRVGFMGSQRMRNYTLLGDNVNLGSRLEGTNKNYGTHIIVSQTTYEQCKHLVYGRWLDAVRVKGKREPVQIFELLGKRASAQAPTPGDAATWIGRFEDGLKHYQAQRWDDAEDAFHAVIRLRTEDPPSEVYLERIEHFRERPPESDWDGVYEFTSK